MKMEYIILSDQLLYKLQKQVNDYLLLGFVLSGGGWYDSNTGRNCQAIIREIKK